MDNDEQRLLIMQAMRDLTEQVMSGEFPEFTIKLEKGPLVFNGIVSKVVWKPPSDFPHPRQPTLVDAGEIDLTVVFSGEIPLDKPRLPVSNSDQCDV